MRGGIRRICSLLWNDINRIQKIGNMKKTSTSVSAAPRKIRPARLLCSITASPRSSRVAVGARPQPQPVLDEDIGEDVGDEPEDHQQRRRTPDIGVLEEFEIG